MAQIRRGCAPAIFLILLVLAGAGGIFGWFYYKRTLPPQPAGGELQITVLDVGHGDAILIVGPEDSAVKRRRVVLIDAGDTGKGKVILQALKKQNIDKIDYLIATHPHVDHIGGADEVMNGISVDTLIDSGMPPKGADREEQEKPKPATGRRRLPRTLPTVVAFNDMKEAAEKNGVRWEVAKPDSVINLGNGLLLTILGPTEPFFTSQQMSRGGNVANANSIVVRLDYGDFSMLFPGDAEAQTEDRLYNREARLAAKILKVAHHGSKYATSEQFLSAVKPEMAIVSVGEYNRYGQPAQSVLDRLRAVNSKLYRTDFNGDVTITTTGKVKDGKLYEVKAAKEAKENVWTGREGTRDDSENRGFIAYGEFGPPPKERKK